MVAQIIAAAEASAKVVRAVFLASVIALLADHIYPGLFFDLPKWIIPTLRLSAIFTAVLSVLSFCEQSKPTVIKLLKLTIAPFTRRRMHSKLLELSLPEIAILCAAIAKVDRTMWYKPDHPTVLLLQEKNLIRPFFCGVIAGDGTSSFEIPMEVWKLLQTMNEFSEFERRGLVEAIASGEISKQQLLQLLPKKHPKVLAG